MKRILFGIMAFATGVALLASPVLSQPPGEKDGKKDGKGGEKGPPRFELGQIFPPPLLDDLNLTAAQVKELDVIKADLKTKLDKLLTVEQMRKVENFRSRGPGGKDGPGGKEKDKDKGEKDKDKKDGPR